MADEERRVFSVIGTLPEPGGYAVAKFSRSARPYEEWILELTQEGASRFYNQFYFSYGHASIADLAHLTMIAENISIVAAVDVLDEQLIDAQESSTRYQSFTRRRYYTPPEIVGSPFAERYASVCDELFLLYQELHKATIAELDRQHSPDRPADMADDVYQRTLRARAFDIARYALPSSTYTGLGYLCSARTLERQISRLASSELAEIRAIGDQLREAAARPALNPLAARLEPEIQAFVSQDGTGSESDAAARGRFVEAVRAGVLTGAAAAPTLVRHTEPLPYLSSTYAALKQAAREHTPATAAAAARGVELSDPTSPEIELAATLLYRGTHSYSQLVDHVQLLPESTTTAIGDLAYAERGTYDDPIRESRVGHQLIFDVCLDNGAFRDLHRHRNCVQIMQPFTASLGYDTPPLVEAHPIRDRYQSVLETAGQLADELDAAQAGLGQYALPLAYRRRALFKMDATQLGYIVETRTKPAGHFSYREIAYEMYARFAERHPSLVRHIRVTHPDVEEFFDR